MNLPLKPEGFFMPVKPQATAKVYYSLFELKRNEFLPLKILIPAFPYKNKSRPGKSGRDSSFYPSHPRLRKIVIFT
jgi:hypothetical protein